MRPEFKQNIFDNFFRQNFTEKEMIIILNNDTLCLNEWKNETAEYHNIHVFKLPQEKTLGECLNFGITKSSYDIIAKFDDDDYYSDHYLTEAYQTMLSSKADIVGKCTSYLYFEEFKKLMIFRPGNEKKIKKLLKGGTLVFKKNVWEVTKFQHERIGSDAYFLKDALKNDFKLFSSSKENYICVRRKDIDSHTQKVNTLDYMNKCTFVTQTENPMRIFNRVQVEENNICTKKKKSKRLKRIGKKKKR